MNTVQIKSLVYTHHWPYILHGCVPLEMSFVYVLMLHFTLLNLVLIVCIYPASCPMSHFLVLFGFLSHAIRTKGLWGCCRQNYPMFLCHTVGFTRVKYYWVLDGNLISLIAIYAISQRLLHHKDLWKACLSTSSTLPNCSWLDRC